ncbi:transcriptional regulator [Lachnospiraceae bacterium OttesenSCG-928-E19]|nr:transcriptional regulator [Lachnospiraceae bacterium OttesenSCG-928-E19]
MATSKEFIEFVTDQIHNAGDITIKKMFGEYMVYSNAKPVLLVCDDTVFVKKLPDVEKVFAQFDITPDTGFPYDGAREHYVLDFENSDLISEMVRTLEPITPLPKPRKSKVKK